MRRLITSLSVLSVLMPSIAMACSIHDKMAYHAVAEDFCTFIEGNRNAPSAKLFTPELLSAIHHAEAINAKIQKANPTEKPPLGDGVPYQAYQDHADFCRPGTNLHIDHQLMMEVQYIFPDAPDANWTDRLKLVKDKNGTWKIDDIIYGRDHQTSLRQMLQNVLPQE